MSNKSELPEGAIELPLPEPLPKRGGLSGLIARTGLLEKTWTPGVFFALTLCTVFYAGITSGQDFYKTLLGADLPWADARVLMQAVIYTTALIAILGTHEMGHWLVSRAHGVKTTLPIFVPNPFGLGTFGAVIAMQELPRDRRSLLRIGAAGPLAGGVVALVLMAFAITTCPLVPPASGTAAPAGGWSMVFGESFGMKLLEWVRGTDVISSDNTLASPLFIATWLGFLLTSINLFPVGQLDGGHVAYAIFGPVMNRIAKPLAVLVMGLAFFGSPTYIGWGALLFLFISWHPPVPQPEEKLPLDAWLLAAASAVLFLLTFMLAPIRIVHLQT